MLNIKSLFTKILNNLLLKTGGTMTGDLMTSYGAEVMGSGMATSQTIQSLVAELHNTNSAMGSVYISTNYTNSGITIAAGWYNYCYIRGTGSDSDKDNLFLCGMTVNNVYYRLRISSYYEEEEEDWVFDIYVFKFDTTEPIASKAITVATTTNYTTYPNNTSICSYRKLGSIVCLTLVVNCVSPVKWPSTCFATVGSDAYALGGTAYGALACSVDHSSMAVQIDSSGQIKGSGGVAGKQYVGTVYYMATTVG